MINNNGCPLPGLAQARAPWQRQLMRMSIFFLCVLFLFSLIPVFSFASSTINWNYGSFSAPPIPNYNPSLSYFIGEATTGDIYLWSFDLSDLHSRSDDIYGIYWNAYFTTYSSYWLVNGSWVFSSNSTNSYVRLYPSQYIWSNFNLPLNDGLSFVGSAPIIPNSDEYVIIRMGSPSDPIMAGYHFSFQVFLASDLTRSLPAFWSITGDNIYPSTTISDSGVLNISMLQEPTTITVIASNINNTGNSAFITIYTVPFDNGSVSPPDSTNQDIIDNVNQGFDDVGNKLEDGFDDVGNKLDDGFNNLSNKIDAFGDSLLGGIYRLFIPSVEDFTASIDSFNEWLQKKFPLLSIPLTLVSYTLNLFISVSPELTTFTFPEISWMGHVLIDETSFSFLEYSWLGRVLPIIRLVSTVSCVYLFIHWLINKVREVGNS